MIWRPDTCGCALSLGADGEPLAIVERCGLHASASAGDVAGECRAKNSVVSAAAASLNVDPDAVVWGFGADRSAYAVNLDFALGRAVTVASSAPLSKAAFVAARSKTPVKAG